MRTYVDTTVTVRVHPGPTIPGVAKLEIVGVTTHPRLQQQLKTFGLTGAPQDAQVWDEFLREVSASYYAADRRGRETPPETAPAADTAGQHAAGVTVSDKLEAVIGCLGEGLMVINSDFRVELINPQGAEILRTSPDQVLGRSFDELATTWRLRDRGPYAVSKMRHHLLRGIAYRNDDAFVVTDEGEIIHVSLVLTPLQSGHDDVGAVISFRDVTTLKVAERALRESEQRFRRIFHEAPTGMIRVDHDGRLADVNAAFEALVGHDASRLAGQPFSSLLHPNDEANGDRWLSDVFAGAASDAVSECRYAARDGQHVWTNTALALVPEAAHQPAFVIGVVEDLTERKRLEVELRHAQKLEAVGMLAAGIAHEINTPVQFIGDNVSFLGQAFADLSQVVEAVDDLPPETAAEVAYLLDEVPLAVEQTLGGVEHVANIVRAMKTFGYRDVGSRSPADLNEAVKSTLVVAQSELKHVADIRTELGALPAVPCYISDLNQVVLNLLVNAAHAVADVVGQSGTKGLIIVRTYSEGDQAVISVSDTGAGIPEAIRERIFDPFFTTKEVGRGTGQGLALAHAVVVDRHGGTLTMETEEGVGTTFFVRIPLR